jgi:hypothetical protein
MGAQIRAQGARETAQKGDREADRAEAEAWSIRMEGYGGPASRHPRSASASTAVSAGSRSSAIAARNERASRWIHPPAAGKSIWKLEASLKCRSCRKGRSAPPVLMIKLTEARAITPYKWVHSDEER